MMLRQLSWGSSTVLRVAGVTALLSCVVVQAAVAQARAREVSAASACARCEIRLHAAVPLRGTYEAGSLPGAVVDLRTTASGHIYAIFEAHRTEIHRFGPDGRPLGPPIGRRGSGPGEFQTLKGLAVDGDRVLAYDLALGRVTAITAATGAVLGTAALPNHFSAAVSRDGALILGGPVATRTAAGHTLHLFSREGEWLRSFGSTAPAAGPQTGYLMLRRVAPAADGGVWAAPINDLRFERWSADGRLQDVLTARRSEFQPWTQPENRTRDRPPQANLSAISVDDEGLLWVIYHVAAPEWRRALGNDVGAHGQPLVEPGRRYVRAFLEVIDTRTGTMLARTELDGDGWGFAGPRVLYRSWLDEMALPRAVVRRAEVVR